MNKQEIEKAIDVLDGNKEGFENLLKDQPDHPMRGHIEHQIDCLKLGISALEQQLADVWIPASKRLPEEVGWYLITTEDNEVDLGHWFINEGWKRGYDPKPIAWMPLPEPYKEG